LVEEIWRKVAADEVLDIEGEVGEAPHFEPLIHDEERRYLNAHCEFDTAPASVPAAGPAPGMKRRMKARAGHFVIAVLERYFADEKQFLAHLVRLQNKLTVNHDRLAEEVGRLHRAFRRDSERQRQRSAVLHSRLEERVAALERELAARSDVVVPEA
jgi:hypothetical protein